jgi:hypothetical protein
MKGGHCGGRSPCYRVSSRYDIMGKCGREADIVGRFELRVIVNIGSKITRVVEDDNILQRSKVKWS